MLDVGVWGGLASESVMKVIDVHSAYGLGEPLFDVLLDTGKTSE